ncbi:MAG TPA: ABC transporter permease [Tepidisphaeraceae bacterium]
MSDTLKRIGWTVGPLILLLILDAVLIPGFFQIQMKQGRLFGIPIDILFYGSRVMLLAIGMTLVIATGGVDLSVGAVMAMASATAVVVSNHGAPLAVAVAAALGVGILAGAWNGMLVTLFGMQPIVATLVLMVAGRGIAQIIAGVPILNFASMDLRVFAAGQFLKLPVSVWIVLLVLVVVWGLARKTPMGLMVEAIGDSPSAARMIGLPVRLVIALTYVVVGVCSALAGLVDAAGVTAADTYNTGLYMELDAILAVVIGGTLLTGGRFFLAGSLLGALLIQTLTTTLLLRDVSPNLLAFPKAVLVIVVCLLQSSQFRSQFRRLSSKQRAVEQMAPVAVQQSEKVTA